MMALADILLDRVSRRGRTAQILCRELGEMTVEALPAGEISALLRSPNGQRAVVYAACRELQAVGEALRGKGQLFQPDEIMNFLSENEVQIALQSILELSGTDLNQHTALPSSDEAVGAAGHQTAHSEFERSLPGMPQAVSAGAHSLSSEALLQTASADGDGFFSSLSASGAHASPSALSLSAKALSFDEEALTERVARRILAGLRQAAAVR